MGRRILKMRRTCLTQQAFLRVLVLLPLLLITCNFSLFQGITSKYSTEIEMEMERLNPMITITTVTDSSKSKDMPTIDHSLVVERALGETTSAHTASILSKTQNTKLSIVISHCNSPVGWIASYMENVKFEIEDITIVSKCGEEEVVGVDILEKSFGKNITIQRLPNIGRCDHTYAHWIQENYDRVQKELLASAAGNENEEDSNNDLIFFVKDNNHAIRAYRPFDVVFATALDAGFACVQRPPKMHKQTALPLHAKQRFGEFVIKEYNHFDRDENSAFKSKYNNLKEWSDDVGLIFPDSDYINVCYGGSFVTQKKGLLSQSELVWAKLSISLSRGNNIAEGHYAERSWASIASPPPPDLPLNAVLGDILQPFVIGPRKHDDVIFCGRLSIPWDSPFFNVTL